MSPTLTANMTMGNVILGTAAYMSPEQARGTEVDKRADIWAYGVVVAEMLGGRKLFAGETVSDTLASVLKAAIDLDDLPDDLPRRGDPAAAALPAAGPASSGCGTSATRDSFCRTCWPAENRGSCRSRSAPNAAPGSGGP